MYLNLYLYLYLYATRSSLVRRSSPFPLLGNDPTKGPPLYLTPLPNASFPWRPPGFVPLGGMRAHPTETPGAQ